MRILFRGAATFRMTRVRTTAFVSFLLPDLNISSSTQPHTLPSPRGVLIAQESRKGVHLIPSHLHLFTAQVDYAALRCRSPARLVCSPERTAVSSRRGVR